MDDLETLEKKISKILQILAGFLVLFLSLVALPFLPKDFFSSQKYLLGSTSSSVTVTVNSVASLPSVTAFNGNANSGSDIVLTDGSATNNAANVTGTVTDYNGCADLTSVVVVVYKNGTTCTSSGNADNDNCYVFTDSTPATSGSCTNNVYSVNQNFNIQFYAISGTWNAKILSAGSYSSGAVQSSSESSGVALDALKALSVADLNYGSLNPGSASTGDNHTTVTNTGNVTVDFKLHGTDLTCGGGGIGSIPVASQQFKLTSFVYGAGTALATTDSSALGANIIKGTQSTPSSTAPVYWQISVPNGVRGTCSGTTTFTIF